MHGLSRPTSPTPHLPSDLLTSRRRENLVGVGPVFKTGVWRLVSWQGSKPFVLRQSKSRDRGRRAIAGKDRRHHRHSRQARESVFCEFKDLIQALSRCHPERRPVFSTVSMPFTAHIPPHQSKSACSAVVAVYTGFNGNEFPVSATRLLAKQRTQLRNHLAKAPADFLRDLDRLRIITSGRERDLHHK